MSTFYAYPDPQCIRGPVITPSKGATWDTVEADFLCVGDQLTGGGFSSGDPFPGVPGFVVDSEPNTQPAAEGGYIATVSGRGVKKVRVYSQPISYADGEIVAELEVTGVPFDIFQAAWPEVDLMKNAAGFRQIVVGATGLPPQPGSKVTAPMVGPFPPAPANIFDRIESPRLQWPFGWVLSRVDAQPLVDGPFQQSGPWIVTADYIYRHKLVPS